MIELTEDHRQALTAGEDPPRLVNPATNEIYVLLRADVYDRIQKMLEEEAEDQTLRKTWLENATRTRRKWVQENPY